MITEARFICACGWALVQLPTRPAKCAKGEGDIAPAKFLLTCRNPSCEHHGRRYRMPFTRTLLREEPCQDCGGSGGADCRTRAEGRVICGFAKDRCVSH